MIVIRPMTTADTTISFRLRLIAIEFDCPPNLLADSAADWYYVTDFAMVPKLLHPYISRLPLGQGRLVLGWPSLAYQELINILTRRQPYSQTAGSDDIMASQPPP